MHRHIRNLKKHKITHTGEKSYECPDCGKAFRQLSNLTRHKKVHTGEKPYNCTDCDRSFRLYSNLTRHKCIHTGEKPYECTDCGKSFRRLANLTTHKRVHTGEKPFECTDCGKTFRQPSHLKTHKRIHTGEMPYECNYCGKAFNRLTNLETHRSIHTGEKPYKCNDCGKEFRQPSHLKTHKRIHIREKIYKCIDCDNAFNQLEVFTKHTRIHIGEKRFTCKKCAKMFSTSGTLSKHMLVHTDKRYHNCTECGRSFRKYVDLMTNAGTHVTVKMNASPKPIRCNIHPVQRKSQFTRINEKITSSLKQRGNVPVQQGRVISKRRNSLARRCTVKIVAINSRDKVLEQKRSLRKRSAGMNPSACTSRDETITKRGVLITKIAVREKPHECGQCGKTFTSPEELDTHKKIHVLGRGYKCLRCGEFFTTTQEHKSKTSLCQRCEKFFPKSIVVMKRENLAMLGKQSRIRRHSVKFDVHNEVSLKAVVEDLNQCEENKELKTGLKDKLQLCDYCTLSFADEDKLKQHIVAHLRQFPYKCDICRRSFNHILHLQKHVSSHK